MRRSFSLFSALFLFVLLLPARAQLRGNGVIKSENRSIREVRAVKVNKGIDLYIRQGDNEKLTLEADENLLKYFVSDVSNGTLTLTIDKTFVQAKTLKAYLTVRSLERLESSGGSDVYSEGVLRAEKMICQASGGSDVRLELDVKNMTINTSGGADAYLKGLASQLQVSASGGSDIKARDLRADVVKATASGGADVHVFADLRLTARASGAGSVYYYGDPQEVNQSSSGGGDVKKR
ncbi:head GIN domain-containing protein [Persicitalea jodogahamensis]|nr:head GIN domain-containing protein [Persicitalea jodogahamensis]